MSRLSNIFYLTEGMDEDYPTEEDLEKRKSVEDIAYQNLRQALNDEQNQLLSSFIEAFLLRVSVEEHFVVERAMALGITTTAESFLMGKDNKDNTDTF